MLDLPSGVLGAQFAAEMSSQLPDDGGLFFDGLRARFGFQVGEEIGRVERSGARCTIDVGNGRGDDAGPIVGFVLPVLDAQNQGMELTRRECPELGFA